MLVAGAWPIFPTNSDADAVTGVLRQLAKRFRYSSSMPKVMNSSLPNENLLRDWNPGHFETFKTEFEGAAI